MEVITVGRCGQDSRRPVSRTSALGACRGRKSSVQGIAPAFRRAGQEFEVLAQRVEMKSGMGVRMAVPTLRRDRGSPMDGSAVGRYTPWVSPLTCMAKGANNPRWGDSRKGSMQPSSENPPVARPYYKVASIIKISTGSALLAFPRKIQPASPASPPCTDTPRY